MTPGQLVFASRIESDEDIREIGIIGAGGKLANTDDKGWNRWVKETGK